MTCDAVIPTCPTVVSLKTLDPETDAPKSRFFQGDRIKFEVQVLNPDSVAHVMRLRLHMDEDPDDGVPGVVSHQHITVPAHDYKMQSYTIPTPDSLPEGWIYVQAVLDDDACTTETPFSYSFHLGTPPPPVPWVTDTGIFSTSNTSISVEWGIEEPYDFDVDHYAYCVGTGSDPCQCDAVDWTQVAGAGPHDIQFDPLAYDHTYYVCVHSTNSYGIQSDAPAVTDGIIILDPLADPDADSFFTPEELSALSDPLNYYSIPGDSTVHLHEGFNLVSFPAEVLFYESIQDLMDALGGGSVIRQVLFFNPTAQKFQEAGYDDGGTSGNLIDP